MFLTNDSPILFIRGWGDLTKYRIAQVRSVIARSCAKRPNTQLQALIAIQIYEMQY